MKLAAFPETMTFPFRPPAVSGLGNAPGMTYPLLDQASVGPATMQEARHELIGNSR